MQKKTEQPQNLSSYIQSLKLQPPITAEIQQSNSVVMTESPAPLIPTANIKAHWFFVRDNYLNHIMGCRLCVVAGLKEPRYCQEGKRLHEAYKNMTVDIIRFESEH